MTREIKITIGDPSRPIGEQLHWKGLDYDTDKINMLNDCGISAQTLLDNCIITNSEYLEFCRRILGYVSTNVKKKNKMTVKLIL